jgi:glucose-6-phosphate 1-dehydrogenase
MAINPPSKQTFGKKSRRSPMENNVRPDPTVFVIFGAGGDLTWRKLNHLLQILCLIAMEAPVSFFAPR